MGDVDFERGQIDGTRSVVGAVGGLAEKLTKTNRSRYVALDPVAAPLLLARR